MKLEITWVILICSFFSYGKAKKEVLLVDGTLVKAPQDQEVCFSPVENCDIKLWKFIQSAQKSLDIAIFDITHPKIAHEIAVASKRIPVRVLVDRRQAKGPHSTVPMLLKASVNVRFGYQRGIMHNKFIIVDSKIVETGSFNFTNNATNNNSENQVYLSNASIVKRYKERFDEIWGQGKMEIAATSK